MQKKPSLSHPHKKIVFNPAKLRYTIHAPTGKAKRKREAEAEGNTKAPGCGCGGILAQDEEGGTAVRRNDVWKS